MPVSIEGAEELVEDDASWAAATQARAAKDKTCNEGMFDSVFLLLGCVRDGSAKYVAEKVGRTIHTSCRGPYISSPACRQPGRSGQTNVSGHHRNSTGWPSWRIPVNTISGNRTEKVERFGCNAKVKSPGAQKCMAP